MQDAIAKLRRRINVLIYVGLTILSVVGWREWDIHRRDQQRILNDQQSLVAEQEKIKARLVPIHIVNSSELETKEIPRGGSLHVRFDITRTARCRVIVTRFIVREPDMAVVWSNLAPGTIQEVGEHLHGTVFVQIPWDLPPGDYIYKAINYNSDCEPGGRSFTAVAPGLPFHIKN